MYGFSYCSDFCPQAPSAKCLVKKWPKWRTSRWWRNSSPWSIFWRLLSNRCRCETGWILLTQLWLIVMGCSGLGQRQYQANIRNALLSKIKTFTMSGLEGPWSQINGTFLAGSPDVIQRLRQLGKRVFYVTNNSTKHRREYKTKVEQLGFGGDLVRWNSKRVFLDLQNRGNKTGANKCPFPNGRNCARIVKKEFFAQNARIVLMS